MHIYIFQMAFMWTGNARAAHIIDAHFRFYILDLVTDNERKEAEDVLLKIAMVVSLTTFMSSLQQTIDIAQ